MIKNNTNCSLKSLKKTCPINHPFGDVSQKKWFNIIKRCIDSLKHAGISGGNMTLNLQGKATDSLFPLIGEAVAMYRQLCRESGVIDFTDLINYAIQLLESHDDIRAYYQNQYSYIIEDEAQDSSQMLQRLIKLLSKEPDDDSHPNLIRTGDTNQSITTTFSSADPTVFRDFIKGADHVVHMDASARCAPEVIELANGWIRHCEETEPLQNAFAPTTIKPIVGANPDLLFPLQTACFETSVDEQDWLTQTILKLRETYPNKSMAVLTLTNASVLDVTATLQAASLPAISLTDHMNNQPVFQVLFNTLQLLANPTQHQHQVALYKALCQLSEQRYALQFFATTTDDDDTTEAHREYVLANIALLYATPQEIADPFLKQLYYDLSDFSRLSLNTNLPTLINHISQQWFINPTERSNGLLCALHCKQWLNQQGDGMSLSPLDDTLKYFTQLYQSPKGLKTFSDAAQSSPEEVIQVMTLHKSKGQEFDIVLMPALQEGHHQVNLDEQIATDLLEAIQTKPSNAETKTEQAVAPTTTAILKQEERARLIFVGLTRAKQGLIATAHHKTKTRYGKFRNVQPDMAYYWLESQTKPKLSIVPSSNEVPTS
jgi:superfamily I DNA/RNA helicase